jgi:uncharacterized protein (TIGR02118 family)
MIKIVFGWRDDPGRSPEECERHYRNVHMGYARQAYDGVPGFVSIRYNRVRRAQVNDFNRREARDVEPDMDAFVELCFDDTESLEKAFADPLLDVMFEDHANFMQVDAPANIRIYHVDETVILEREH